jgi:hypothetical protein
MKLVCFLLVFFSQVVSADSKIPGQLSFALGSISANYTENPDQLKASDGTTAAATTPYAGTASAMPVAITYESSYGEMASSRLRRTVPCYPK